MSKHFYVDASNQVAGKLSTFIAKTLLEGNKVSVVHCENIVFTGPIERGMKKYERYLRKRRIVNPLKGQFHYKEPSKYFKRVIRRMVPKKKEKGFKALKNLKVYEGCPQKYQDKEFYHVPKALIKYTADPKRKFYILGDLLRRYGWKDYELVRNLNIKEEKRRKFISEKKDKKQQEIEQIKLTEEYKTQLENALKNFE